MRDRDNEDEEQRKLEGVKVQRMARIMLQQAIQTAKSSANTQILERDEELVYGAGIANQDGSINAGNGRGLYTETKAQEEDNNRRPRSSV